MNYDEVIKELKALAPYTIKALTKHGEIATLVNIETGKIGNPVEMIEDIYTTLETAKKEHEELSAIKQRAEEYAKDYQLTSEEIYCINYIIKGEGK